MPKKERALVLNKHFGPKISIAVINLVSDFTDKKLSHQRFRTYDFKFCFKHFEHLAENSRKFQVEVGLLKMTYNITFIHLNHHSRRRLSIICLLLSFIHIHTFLLKLEPRYPPESPLFAWQTSCNFRAVTSFTTLLVFPANVSPRITWTTDALKMDIRDQNEWTIV